MKSLLDNDHKCWVCGDTRNLHKHHVFYGSANRKLAEKYGCWVYLCPIHHNMSNKGVHFDHDLDTLLKKTCQRAWERKYGDTDKFRKVFGKSYL